MSAMEEIEQARVYMEASIRLGIKQASRNLREGVDKPEIVVQIPGAVVGSLWRKICIRTNSLQCKALKSDTWETTASFEIHDNAARGTYGNWAVSALPEVHSGPMVLIRLENQAVKDGDEYLLEPLEIPRFEKWVTETPTGLGVEETLAIMEMFTTFTDTDRMPWREALHAASRLTL